MLIGAIVTAAATHLLVIVPELIGFGSFRAGLVELTGVWFWDDPLPSLRFLGGIVGGYAAGYLTRGTHLESYANAIEAVLLGVGIYYVTNVAGNAIQFLLAGRLTGTALLVITVQPLLFLVVPMAFLYAFEAMFVGPIGNLTAGALTTRITRESVSGDGVEAAAWAATLRSLAAALVCLVLLVAVWGFVFYLGNVLFAY